MYKTQVIIVYTAGLRSVQLSFHDLDIFPFVSFFSISVLVMETSMNWMREIFIKLKTVDLKHGVW